MSYLCLKAVCIDERRVCMDDESIIRLYWERDERAIEITAEKYGPYCEIGRAHV